MLPHCYLATADAGFNLLRNPRAVVVLEANSGLLGDDQAIQELAMEVGLGLYRFFENLIQEGAGRVETTRVFIRSWGSTTAGPALAVDDEHAIQVRDGKAWVEVFFRLAEKWQFCVPPKPYFYCNIPVPTVTQYSEHHDFMARSYEPMDPEGERATIEALWRGLNETEQQGKK